MINRKLIFILCIVIGSCFLGYSQKTKFTTGRELRFNIVGSNDTVAYLAVHYKDRFILMDTMRPLKRGQFISTGKDTLKGGLYSLISQSHKPYLSFILDGKQNFTISGDTSGNVDNITVVNSPQNIKLLEFSQKSYHAGLSIKEYREKIKQFETLKLQDSITDYQKYIKQVSEDMNTYIQTLIKNDGQTLFGKMQKAYQMIDIPEMPIKPDGTRDSLFPSNYYKQHYFDNIDLTDSRLIYTPVLYPKITDYVTKVLQYAESDTIMHYINLLMDKMLPKDEIYRYVLDYLTYYYETSKVLGHDAVFVNLAKTYQLQGKCEWLDTIILDKYARKIAKMEPTLIGNQAPFLTMPDTNMSQDVTQWHSIYDIKSDYLLLWFFDPDCGTCKRETKKLVEFYNTQAKDLGIEVYSICIDNDIDRWKRYIKENKLPFICVGGNTANIDFREVYNVLGTPAMFILDKNHKIILNKRIDIEQIPELLQQYEAIQKRKH